MLEKTSMMKEEDKVHQETNIMKDEFRLGQPIMFSSSKIKLLSRRSKKKWLSLWVVKEIMSDGIIDLESTYSKRIKVITKKILQQRTHPL